MERIDLDIIGQNSILYKEHQHRYLIAEKLVTGNILDCACGGGYGTYMLAQKKPNCNFTGVDVDEKSIQLAKERFNSSNLIYKAGSICNLGFPDESFDVVISFETLEHITDIDTAFSEIYRVLKKDGVLIGSVPSEFYDDYCASVYGKNEFHLTKFDLEKLRTYLSKYFKFFKEYSITFCVVTLLTEIKQKEIKNLNILLDNYFELPNNVMGSYGFIASKGEGNINLSSLAYYAKALAEVDSERDYLTAIRKLEEMVKARDEHIKADAKLLKERYEIMQKMEEMVKARDEHIKADAKLLKERYEIMQKMEEMIKARKKRYKAIYIENEKNS